MNRRINMLSAFVLLTVLMAALIVACAPNQVAPEPAAPETLDGKALTEERCTKCHDLTRVKQAKKTSEEWKTTVERMVSKGAELNASEQAAVIEYVSEAYPN